MGLTPHHSAEEAPAELASHLSEFFAPAAPEQRSTITSASPVVRR